MPKDFRDLLVEANRSERFGRYFDEIAILTKFRMSVQASDAHECTPCETLDDLREYETFEVAFSQLDRPLTQPKYGAWEELQNEPWAGGFESGVLEGYLWSANVPAQAVQDVYESLLAYAEKHA